MLTRKQKEKVIQEESEGLKGGKTLIFTDFTGLSANEANALRKSLRDLGAKYRVMKKRLLGLVLKEYGVDVERKNLEGQVGLVVSPEGVSETAGKVYAFFKEHKDRFKLLGGVEMEEKKVLSKSEVEMIGSLPPREVLLGQLVYMLGSPIRKFMFVLNEKSKKI